MKLLLLTFILFNNPKEIGYRTLIWSDFKGPVTSSSAAVTTTQLQFDWEETDGKYIFKVTAWFLPYESFSVTTIPEVLFHENLHFAITRLKALQCMRALQPYQGCNGTKRKKAEAIYAHYVYSLNQLQQLYDRETNHSLNLVVQGLWEKNIKSQIKKLE